MAKKTDKAAGGKKAAKPAKQAKSGAASPGKGKISFKARPKKKKMEAPKEPPPPPRLKTYYQDTVRPALKEKFGLSCDLGTPRLTKIVINMGVGDANENPRKLEALMEDLEAVSGQHAQVTRARISVANFNLREGMAVGARVTLRRARMWEFLDRLLSVVIPRMRDFRGLNPKSFDGRGNFAMGLPDQLVFPEIKGDRVEYFHGMDLVFCTTARSDEQARELFRLLGFPYRDLDVVVLGSKES